MNAAARLIAAALAAQTHPQRIPSPRQQTVTANLSLISRTWRTLSEPQRQTWIALGRTWSPTPGKTTATGLACFVALNGVRLNTGLGDILPQAPAQPDFVGKLPRFQVAAHVPAQPALLLSDKPNNAPRFALFLQSPPFSGPVAVLATRPLSAGVSQPSPRDFRQIAVLPSISAAVTDISGAYLSQFQLPADGMKVAVQLVPVTPNGFKGSPFTQLVTITQAPPIAPQPVSLRDTDNAPAGDSTPQDTPNAGAKKPPAGNNMRPLDAGIVSNGRLNLFARGLFAPAQALPPGFITPSTSTRITPLWYSIGSAVSLNRHKTNAPVPLPLLSYSDSSPLLRGRPGGGVREAGKGCSLSS